MKQRPFLRALLIGAAAALILLLAFAAWRHWLAPAAEPEATAQGPELDVPYVATIEEVVDVMLDLAEVGPSDHVIDLGAGDGRIVIAAARRGASGYGVDPDPRRVAEAKANAREAGVEDRVSFEVRDLFRTPVSDATVVAVYLLPEINLQLRPRLLDEMRPGARLVSHAFDMGDWRPDRSVDVEGAQVHLWIVPADVAGRWTFTGEGVEGAAVTFEQRYQQLSGTIEAGGTGQPLREARLGGDRIFFTADLGAGPRGYEGRVEGDRIVPTEAGAGWRMERAG